MIPSLRVVGVEVHVIRNAEEASEAERELETGNSCTSDDAFVARVRGLDEAWGSCVAGVRGITRSLEPP